MKRGEIYTGKVRELAFPNIGKVSVEGADVVIKNTLPGQEISFILTKNKTGLKEGRLLELLKRSDIETEKGCSVCRICGGCVYQTISYEDELKLKEDMVIKILGKALEQFDPVKFDQVYEGITGSPGIFGYRNKMEFSFGNAIKDGPLTLGMHVPGHFMDVTDTPDCNIVDGDFRMIRSFVSDFAADNALSFYHRYSNTGFLRNLLVRKGINTGEILIDIVTTSDGSLDGDAFAKGLRELPLKGGITGILHTVDDAVADVIKNEGTSVLYGRDHIYDEILGLRFKISAFSFFQTNTHGAEVLYERVREYVRSACSPSSGAAGVVYDLYSGTGTIAQLVAESASMVYGVEIVPEAVEAARANAGLNAVDNVSFICGDVLKVLDGLEEPPDLIILDPPRDGVNPKALKKILDYGVNNIIYISCKITSLSRDLNPILDAGYTPVRISVIDMFPRTANMETVCLLSNRKPDTKVRIDVDLEDYYRIKDAKKDQN